MDFYESISRYYDLIFPVGQEQLDMITKTAGQPPKALLDVACGTGGYSLELAKRGYNLTAVDLDNKMVGVLKTKAADHNLSINAFQCDMLELSGRLSTKFDLAFCIGNSVVHLGGETEVERFFLEIKEVVAAGGKFLVQIVNFDRILEKDISSLPTIVNKDAGLKFERFYRHDKASNTIFFRTNLTVDEKQIQNEIPLYPILAHQMVRLLTEAGFSDLRLYGDFKGSGFDAHNSYALVIVAS